MFSIVICVVVTAVGGVGIGIHVFIVSDFCIIAIINIVGIIIIVIIVVVVFTFSFVISPDDVRTTVIIVCIEVFVSLDIEFSN